jgi:RHS repeat-associated protein
MTHDPSKMISVSYNHLNLPRQIDFGPEDNIQFAYTATGARLRKTVSSMKTTAGSVTDYCGNFIYADNQLITIFAGDVRVVPVNVGNSTYWKYEYSMKDHTSTHFGAAQCQSLSASLGNVRVVFAAHSHGQSELLQQTSYYPFGMILNQQSYYSQNATENKFLYNSKELQDDQLAGNTLDWYDYGARFYDATLGRWHVVDPLAEKYVNISPFTYAANNPILFIDKNGKEIYIITQNKDVVKGTKVLQQTSIGKQLWDKYGRNDNHDIYISAQSFTENEAGGLAYAYSNNFGMIKDGKVNVSQFYSDAAYTKDFSSFDGLDVSKSKGKNVHLVSINTDYAGDDLTKGKDSFNGAAFKIFHEIDAHIDKYSNGDGDAEHEKHGYGIVTIEINGQKVQAVSIKKGSDAWKMMVELIGLRQQEKTEDEDKK